MKTIPLREKLQATLMNGWNIFNRKNSAEKGQDVETRREPVNYVPPSYPCTRNVLLCGSAYGDVSYQGAYLLDTQAALDWVKKHSTSVWSLQQEQQQAREYIPIWFANPAPDDDHIALLDPGMRGVLMPYLLDFHTHGWLSIYCLQCRKNYESMTTATFGAERNGPYSTWTAEWRCPTGHIVHRKKNEIRYFIPRGGNGSDTS
jgi:hypothetical protein